MWRVVGWLHTGKAVQSLVDDILFFGDVLLDGKIGKIGEIGEKSCYFLQAIYSRDILKSVSVVKWWKKVLGCHENSYDGCVRPLARTHWSRRPYFLSVWFSGSSAEMLRVLGVLGVLGVSVWLGFCATLVVSFVRCDHMLSVHVTLLVQGGKKAKTPTFLVFLLTLLYSILFLSFFGLTNDMIWTSPKYFHVVFVRLTFTA